LTRKILPSLWEKREMDDDKGKGFGETKRGVDVPWTSMRRIKSMRRKGPKKECTPHALFFICRPCLREKEATFEGPTGAPLGNTKDRS
jgi:hypothetical protein